MVLDDESCALTAAAAAAAVGLRNGSSLYLEQGTCAPPNSVLLQVVLVRGNSHEAKYSSAAEAGERLQEVEITAQLSDSVQSVRDRAGVLLCHYAEGWTQRCEVLAQGSGIRNHLGEEMGAAVDASFELAGSDEEIASIAADIAPAQAVLPVDSAPISDADLLNHRDSLLATAQAEFGPQFPGLRLRKTSWLKEYTEVLVAEKSEEVVTINIAVPAVEASGAAVGASSAASSTAGAAVSKQANSKVNKGKTNPPASSATVPTKVNDVSTAQTTANIVVSTPLTVKDAGLKSGDTLFLEEGPLPVKGLLSIQVKTEVTCCLSRKFIFLAFVPAAFVSTFELHMYCCCIC